MIRVSTILVYLIVRIRVSKSETHKTRLQELTDFHTELEGTNLQAYSAVQAAYTDHSIPHIVHQTWKTHSIPALYRDWTASWSKVHPSWLHVIWSDEENLRLIQAHYPGLLATYLGLPANICRADAVRPLILHRYGGVYVDLDAQALRPLDSLLDGLEVVVARMGQDPAFQHSIPNAFMASRQGEDFLMFFSKHIQKMQHGWATGKMHPSIEAIAGPIALKAAVDRYQRQRRASRVTVLPSETIFPVDWSAKKRGLVPAVCDWGGKPQQFNATACISVHHPQAYSVQWWTHSWL